MGGRRRAASERPNACLRYDGAGNAQVVRTCARPFGERTPRRAVVFLEASLHSTRSDTAPWQVIHARIFETQVFRRAHIRLALFRALLGRRIAGLRLAKRLCAE